jgi:MFS family permease
VADRRTSPETPGGEAPGGAEPGGRWRALSLLASAELFGMSPWFSAAAVSPALAAEWRLTGSQTAWLTLAVQIGFVAGTLLSAIGNLPDVFSTRRFCGTSALLAAASNAALALFARGLPSAVALRFATGFFLAGVYPPAMKVLATWFRRDRGTALGVLIGALTLGKAAPYLVNAAGGSWRTDVLAVSAFAAIGGLVILASLRDGPFAPPLARFDPKQAGLVFANRGVRLASLGYFGHMWELYAMWTWAPVMIRASLAARGARPALGEAAAFVVIGAGAAGCVAAGRAADRAGRTLVASAAMAISGACCLVTGFLFGASPWLLVAVAAVWGASVVADSAQFSACVTELSDPKYMGTALTLQTCVGFLITTGSIELVPRLVASAGWGIAFAALAPGPILGILAMARLRALPEAVRIAHGKR